MNLKRHKIISQADAHKLTNSFISSLKKEVDVLETWAWFDIDDFNAYINEAQEIVKKEGNKLSGIKIYIGKYADKKQEGTFTVYIVPTQKGGIKSLNTPKDAEVKLGALNLGGSGIEKY